MLKGTFYLFLAFCSHASGVKSSMVLLNNYSSEKEVKNHASDRHVFHKVVPINREIPEIQSIHRIKRGIVIVDDDFDVPPGMIRNGKDFKSEIFDHTGYESAVGGSGDEADGSANETTTSIMEIYPTSPSVTVTEKTSVQDKKFTELKLKSTTVSTPRLVNYDSEGSGDNVLHYTKEYSTTEASTQPSKDAYEPIPDICLNTTCSSNDLLIDFTEKSNLIPEGKNLTFSCINNNSDYTMLFWYKSNGSIHFLNAFGREQILLLNVPDTKTIHSGLYMCVKWISKESCCNLKMHLTVYEIPQYTYHFIILALIALACLIICIFLAVRQSMSVREYTDQFAQKHGSVNQQLL